jgi:hypothetical protein
VGLIKGIRLRLALLFLVVSVMAAGAGERFSFVSEMLQAIVMPV